MIRVLAVFAVFLASTCAFGQGLLARARHATYGKPRSSAPAPQTALPAGGTGWASRPSGSYWSSEEEEALGALAVAGLFVGGVAVTSPLWGPAALLEDNTHNVYFPAHPYALADSNYALASSHGRNNPSDASPFDHDYLKMWGLRAGVEDGSRFDGVNRVGARAWFDNSSRLGCTANWDIYTERLPCGCVDQLTLGDLAFTYRIAQSGFLQMHAGLGGRGMFSAGTTRGGFNFLYSADLFPLDPVVISTSAEAGHLNDAFTLRLHASVGANWHRLEAYAGYDWLRIGGVDLHGPMLGLRLWF
jgi:hypothetical protein